MRKRSPVRRFKRFCETRSPSKVVLYETVVNYDSFGAVLGMPFISYTPYRFLRFPLAGTAWGDVLFRVFEGSRAQEPDSIRNLMTRGRDERPRAETQCSDHPKTSYFTSLLLKKESPGSPFQTSRSAPAMFPRNRPRRRVTQNLRN